MSLPLISFLFYYILSRYFCNGTYKTVRDFGKSLEKRVDTLEKRSENELTSMKKQSEERLKEIEKQSEERLKKTEKQSKDNLTEIESLLEDIKNKHKSVNNLSEHYDNLAKNVYEKEKEVDKFCSLISKKMQSIEITADSGFDKKFTGREANYEINSKVSDGINYLNKDFSLASEEASAKLINFQEQKKKEETNIEVLMSYNLSVLPDYPSILKELVTINRMEEIKKFLMYFQDHRILLLTGTGGIGKTTIARALIDLRPENVPVPFWFDFRQNKDVKLGDILEKLASYMNCPDIAKFRVEKREAEKKDIDKLTDKLQIENPVWLIFDSLETILDDVYFHDEDMDLFFTCLHNSTHQAKIIITSRISPTFKSGEYLVDGIEEEKQDIKGLNTNFAVEYLVKNGLGNLDSNKLEELAKGVDGHPLALQLLVGVIKKFGVSDTLEDLTIYKRLKEGTIKKTRKLFEKLAGDQKELLERVSVFRQAEPMDAIKIMFTDKTPVEAIDKLIDKSLLETDHKGKYWLHPLVQEFSYEELKNKKEAHLIAYSYYKSVVLHESPTKKEVLQPVIEAFYHACEAEEYDLAADVIWEFNFQSNTPSACCGDE
jgi:NB-ARC domain